MEGIYHDADLVESEKSQGTPIDNPVDAQEAASFCRNFNQCLHGN